MSPSLSAAELFTVKGLVAVVTGGATGESVVEHWLCQELAVTEKIGIGLMIAKGLEENGAKVYIVGRRKDVLESVAKKEAVRLVQCSKSHGRAHLGFSSVMSYGSDESSHRNTGTSFLSWAT